MGGGGGGGGGGGSGRVGPWSHSSVLEILIQQVVVIPAPCLAPRPHLPSSLVTNDIILGVLLKSAVIVA